ncbi:hypothetical protein [Rhodoligotrophos ferricapiens]|uniref:hypothetical protein n=1 Tax=Rhodoligotrophos ferricapiens TaxID=3069264 RepID=UPI00315C62A1
MNDPIEITVKELREIEISLMNGRSALMSVSSHWPSDEWKHQLKLIERALRLVARKLAQAE